MKNQFTHYHFAGQRENEEILSVLHRHWFDIITKFISIFFMLVFFVGSYTFPFLAYDLFSEPDIVNLVNFVRSLILLFIWMFAFLIFIDYYFDVWIVTNQRIVNIEQKALFSRVVSELKLEKIQDVTTDVKGVIPTFLNFGDLLVQTAAERERFVFHNIPDPYSVKDLIMSLQRKFILHEENQFSEMIRKKIKKDTD